MSSRLESRRYGRLESLRRRKNLASSGDDLGDLKVRDAMRRRSGIRCCGWTCPGRKI
jgi:hypothetical protein